MDGGETWTRVPLPASTTFIDDNYESLQGACQVIGKTIWFMAADGILFRSHDKGEHWEMFSTPIDTNDIMLNITRTIAFADTLNGMALLATYNWATQVNSNQFFRTSDGGATWTAFVPNGSMPQFNAIIPVPGAPQTFVGQGKEIPASAVSTDFGESWTTIDDRYGYSCTAFLSPAIGWSSLFNGYDPHDPNTPAMFKWQDELTLASAYEAAGPSPCRIFPNPFSDHIEINSPRAIDHYRIYTLEGETIGLGTVESREIRLGLKELPWGTYFLDIRYANGSRSTHTIIGGY